MVLSVLLLLLLLLLLLSITVVPGLFRTEHAMSVLAFVAEKSKGHSTVRFGVIVAN